jgi:hypothetical protein
MGRGNEMKRSELVKKLNDMPDIEVGTTDGEVYSVEQSTYDDVEGTHPYIHLEIDEGV